MLSVGLKLKGFLKQPSSKKETMIWSAAMLVYVFVEGLMVSLISECFAREEVEYCLERCVKRPTMWLKMKGV